MPKRNIKKEEDRLFMAGLAKKNKRERLSAEIAGNNDLQTELARLREQYGITTIQRGDKPWIFSQSDETLSNLTNDVQAIEDKYCVNIAGMIYKEIWGLNLLPSQEDIYKEIAKKRGKHLGEEEYLVVRNNGVSLRLIPEYEIIISPETDIRNELVLQEIEALQKEIIKKENPPPQPQKISGSRKKDWRPLLEWVKIHPQFTIKEIAYLLGHNEKNVIRALKNADRIQLE